MNDTKTKTLTKYVILIGSDNAWKVQGTVEATGSDAAVRLYAGKNVGLYVAVPERSWQPVQVQQQVKTSLRLTPVSAIQHGEGIPT